MSDRPEPAPTRGRPRRAETDAAVNAATRTLLAHVGYTDLTIEAVAKHAGVGKPTVYRRHPSKAALVAAALLEELEGANPSPPDTGDVAEDTRQVLANLSTLLTSTDFGRGITEIVSPAGRDPELAEVFSAAVAQRRLLIRDVLQRAADEQRLAAVDVETAIDLALGAVYYRHLVSHAPLDDGFVMAVVASLVTAPPPA